MEAGIVGLPNVGKSTLFNALTKAGALAANYPFATIEPNVGVVPIPDPRLEIIRKHIESQKILPAALRLVDIAGLVRGASKGEGKGNAFLSHIREVDAIVQVVRCFESAPGGEDITHVEGSVDPARDIDTINTELLLADLQSVDGALSKAERAAKSGEREAVARFEVLKKVRPILDSGKPAITVKIDDPEPVGDGLGGVRRPGAASSQGELDVSRDVEMVEEASVLGDQAEALEKRIGVVRDVEPVGSQRIGFEQRAEQRRLPGARRTDDHSDLVRPQFQRDTRE